MHGVGFQCGAYRDGERATQNPLFEENVREREGSRAVYASSHVGCVGQLAMRGGHGLTRSYGVDYHLAENVAIVILGCCGDSHLIHNLRYCDFGCV